MTGKLWRQTSALAALTAGLVLGGRALAQEASPKPVSGTKTASREEKKEMETPKVGAAAPDFKIKDHAGKEISLSQFKGKQNVLLAFFPAAFTGG